MMRETRKTEQTVSSRRHPIAARYRAAARGELTGLVLLDGVHLLAEALQAGVRIREAAVTHDAAGRSEIAALLPRVAGTDAEVTFVSASVMGALSPVKSSSGIVALA